MYKIALTLSLLVLGNFSCPQIKDSPTQSENAVDDYDKELKTVQVGKVSRWCRWMDNIPGTYVEK
jgi:hypothetical protein